MKTASLLGLLLFLQLGLSAKTYNIQELGANTGGTTKCTELINQTIRQAAAEGGGTLYFPAGDYLTGPITMESNITLQLEAGATLHFSTDFEDYTPFRKIRWEGIFMHTFSPLIYARDAKNIAIKGEGTLEGNGAAWWNEVKEQQYEVWREGSIKNPNKLQQLWIDQNKDITYSPYYEKSLAHRFFRPPFIQFIECDGISLDGITIRNSPFWTFNPVGCNNLVVHGVEIDNPDDGWNTDGINPSSCTNMRVSDCLISVGDDCITIKSGRDLDGRNYGKPTENLTITNCVMLAGHGGVVIGSEMSGGVKNVTISNCVFDGTDAGIRLKASRGRGGVVENIRVDNIVMRNIQKNAFIFNLFYDKTSEPEPVSARTPIFRNIHISNVTGVDIKKAGFIRGIEEMPVSEISFNNVKLEAEEGFSAHTAENLQFDDVAIATQQGPSFSFEQCTRVVLANIRTKAPLAKQAVLSIDSCSGILIRDCFPPVATDVFAEITNSQVIWGKNYFDLVKEKVQASPARKE